MAMVFVVWLPPFIKDYNEEMETASWKEIATIHKHSDLLMELQPIHDCFDPEEWAEVLEDLSIRWEFAKPQLLIDKLNAK